MHEQSGNMPAADSMRPMLSECVEKSEIVASQQSSPIESTLPPLLIRGLNFAQAMARHAASGFKRCSKKQISERLEICQSCPHLQDNHCSLCGCACIAENQLMNKLALASEKCPLGKWE